MVKKRKKEGPDVKIIKTSLESIVLNKKINGEFEDILIEANNIRSDTYKFIKTLCLKKINNNEELSKITKKLLVLTMNKVLSKQNKNFKVKDKDMLNELLEFYKTEYKPICKHEVNDAARMKYVIEYMSTEILTNIENNLKEHYFQRLKKYLRNIGEIILDNSNLSFTKKQKKCILNKLIRNVMQFEYDQIDPVFQDWFQRIVQVDIIPNEFQKALSYDCRVDPQKYLKYTINICKTYEIHNSKIEEQIANLKEDEHWKKMFQNKKEIAKLQKDNKIYEVKMKQKEQRGLKIKSPTFQLNKRKFPLFNVFPSSPYGIGYVKFDTLSLINFFCEKDKVEMISRAKNDKGEIWNLLFNMNHPIFKGNKKYKFDHMISTDGVACSVHFRKIGTVNHWQKLKDMKQAKLEREQNPIPTINVPTTPEIKIPEFRKFQDLPKEYLMKFDNVIFMDPGTKFIIYCMDKFGKYWKFSAAQRRDEIGSSIHSQILINEKNNNRGRIRVYESRLSKRQKTSVDYEKYSDYLGFEHYYSVPLRKFYRQPLWRKLKWRRFINQQRSETDLLRTIKEQFGYKGDKILIVIGDWSKKEGMKFGTPTLGIGMRRLLAREFPVVLMDEYNTSKVCNSCHSITEDVSIKGKHVHRLLGCRKCNKFTEEQKIQFPQAAKNPRCKYIQRDQNACRNFLTIFQYALENGMKERPLAFRH